ncbi:uncharacterized protein K441DRAFT_654877 [Cenococcum geophilum 1.58]|uniref:uncharacterized protein n=1 Tax=Cenococcum geophilum 1.58 TaxID=794803 RepID=UPI00358FE461|nr:hypothetical protein K441DRAFT_654877 [Cenococcum geophilum 1.58]
MQDGPPRTSHGEYTRVSPPQIHRICDKHPPSHPSVRYPVSIPVWDPSEAGHQVVSGASSPHHSLPTLEALTRRYPTTACITGRPLLYLNLTAPLSTRFTITPTARVPRPQRLLPRSRDDRVPHEQPAEVHLLIRAGIRIPSPHRQHDQHRNHNHNHNPPLRQTYYIKNPWHLTYAPHLRHAPFYAHLPLTLLAHPHLPSLCGWRPLARVSGAGVRRGVIVIVIVIGAGGWRLGW